MKKAFYWIRGFLSGIRPSKMSEAESMQGHVETLEVDSIISAGGMIRRKYGLACLYTRANGTCTFSIEGYHVHTDLTLKDEDKNALSYKTIPLSFTAGTIWDAAKGLVKLGDEHPVIKGRVCGRNCPHFLEF